MIAKPKWVALALIGGNGSPQNKKAQLRVVLVRVANFWPPTIGIEKADLRKRELFVMVTLAQGGWLGQEGENRMFLRDGFVKMAGFQFFYRTNSLLIR